MSLLIHVSSIVSGGVNVNVLFCNEQLDLQLARPLTQKKQLTNNQFKADRLLKYAHILEVNN